MLAIRIVFPVSKFEMPFAVKNTSEFGYNRGECVDFGEQGEQTSFKESCLRQTKRTKGFVTLVLDDPTSEPFHMEWRHRVEVTHTKDQEDRRIPSENVSTIVNSNVSLGDHFVCDAGVTECSFVVVSEDWDGVNNVVAVFSDLEEIVFHVM